MNKKQKNDKVFYNIYNYIITLSNEYIKMFLL